MSKSDRPCQPTVDFKDSSKPFARMVRMSVQATKHTKQCGMCGFKHHCWPNAVYHDKVTSRAKKAKGLVQSPPEKGTVMPYIFVRDYDIDLMEMNKIFITSLSSLFASWWGTQGGVPSQERTRLPLTLRENFSPDMGFLSADTETRDIRQVELELQTISRLSYNGANVCVPISPLSRELDSIQRLSPKLGGYLKKRMDSIGMTL